MYHMPTTHVRIEKHNDLVILLRHYEIIKSVEQTLFELATDPIERIA
jgi:hypothetical protein